MTSHIMAESVFQDPLTTPLEWTDELSKAAELFARVDLSIGEIALQSGVDPATLHTLRRHPEFAQRVRQHLDLLRRNHQSDKRNFSISQSEVERWPNHKHPNFAGELRQYRESAGLSQSRLAARAGFDHSYISRLESDARAPTRDAVLAIAKAMGVTPVVTDHMLASAGFLPLDVSNLLADEPVIGEAYALLTTAAFPDDVREDVRSAVRMALRQAQRAVNGWEIAS